MLALMLYFESGFGIDLERIDGFALIYLVA